MNILKEQITEAEFDKLVAAGVNNPLSVLLTWGRTRKPVPDVVFTARDGLFFGLLLKSDPPAVVVGVGSLEDGLDKCDEAVILLEGSHDLDD